MIQISGITVEPDTISEEYPQNSIEGKIADMLLSSSEVYAYDSLYELDFELKMRKSIVNAAKNLYQSGLSFRTFRDSKCNEEFWERTNEGGFWLKENANPYDAINDIYKNTRMYGTECSTAIVIIFYKAVLDVSTQELFNELFPQIYLMNWQHLDSNLAVTYYMSRPDYVPGDCRYFKNPDVDPLTPEWQGENTIDLGNGMYYGHGIGIRTAEGIIEVLNRNREPGSETSAYLLESVTLPDFKYLASIMNTTANE